MQTSQGEFVYGTLVAETPLLKENKELSVQSWTQGASVDNQMLTTERNKLSLQWRGPYLVK